MVQLLFAISEFSFNNLIQNRIFIIVCFLLLSIFSFKLTQHFDTYRFSGFKSYNKKFTDQINLSAGSKIQACAIMNDRQVSTTWHFYISFFWVLFAVGVGAVVIIYSVLVDQSSFNSISDYFKFFNAKLYFTICGGFVAVLVAYWFLVFAGSFIAMFFKKMVYGRVPRAQIKKLRIKK